MSGKSPQAVALCQPGSVFAIRGNPMRTPSRASTSIATVEAMMTSQPASINDPLSCMPAIAKRLAKAGEQRCPVATSTIGRRRALR